MITRGNATLGQVGLLARQLAVNIYCHREPVDKFIDSRSPAAFTDFAENDAPEPLLAAGLIRPAPADSLADLYPQVGINGPTRSEEVREYHRRWARRRYLQRLAEGRCVRCGKLTQNGPRCVVCQSVHRATRSGQWDATAREQRKFSRYGLQEERRQSGLCVLCGAPYRGKFVRCRRCRTRERRRPSYVRRRSGADEGSAP
jgi:hypothetical protein